MGLDIVEYLAIDPGQSIGIARFNDKGEVQEMFILKGQEALEDYLEALPITEREVIVEDYKLFKHKALQQSGSRVVAAKCIGGIESWARRRKHRVILQPASTLTIAQLWSGLKLPSNHDKSHHYAAFNHGYYYLVKKKVIALK